MSPRQPVGQRRRSFFPAASSSYAHPNLTRQADLRRAYHRATQLRPPASMPRGSPLLLSGIALLTVSGCTRTVPPSVVYSPPPPTTQPAAPVDLPPPQPVPKLQAL